MEPKITLAMPVYNGERYIQSAVDSILAQDFADFELIINDNASTDSTEAICRDYASKDARVRYIRNEKNLGAAPNYNLGYENARGDYLKWCAHDDLISPNFLSTCLKALEASPEASLAFGRTQCIDHEGKEIPWDEGSLMEEINDDDSATRFHTAITRAGTCFPIFGLFRMSVLKRTTLHRSYYGSDRALIAETALLGKCLQVNEATFFNREHQTRSINMVNHADRSRWQNTSGGRAAAMEHVNLLRHLLEIAGRHPDVVSPMAARMKVARVALTGRQLGRYALDLVRYVSPEGGARLKRAFAGRA